MRFRFTIGLPSIVACLLLGTASLVLAVEPRIYQQTWFVVAVALALTFSLAGLISFGVRKAEKRSKNLSALVENRTRELREEITERQRVEAALRHSEEQQNAILLRMPVVLYSARTPNEIDAEWISQNVERVTGFPPSSFTEIPHFWTSRLHPDDHSTLEAQTEALRNGAPFDCEYRWLCANGSYRWFLDQIVSVQPRGGGVFEYLGVLLDITERREGEERLKASLQEKEVLLKEIHHRVKNNLTVINSLLNLQASTLTDRGTKAVLREAANRVGSMAAIHEQLYRSSNLAAIDFRPYVERLVTQLLRTYAPGHVTFDLDIKGIFFEINAAIPCGLIINELVTNSLKYAFPERAQGSITVRITISPDGMRTLMVRDDGIGLPGPVDVANISTLGLRLVSLLAQQLGGSAEITSQNGTCCTVEFPPPSSSAPGQSAP